MKFNNNDEDRGTVLLLSAGRRVNGYLTTLNGVGAAPESETQMNKIRGKPTIKLFMSRCNYLLVHLALITLATNKPTVEFWGIR